jgi:ABC-2 type transport system ATP-binding protein
VGLAQALIHDPSVLILDEPTSGLDPNQIVEIRKFIGNLGRKKTILLSTHIMQEVEAICDRVIIINLGKIVANEKTEDLRKQESSLERMFQRVTQK